MVSKLGKILMMLGALILLPSPFSRDRAGENLERRFFGIPPGTLSVYKLKFETEKSGISKGDFAKVTALRSGGALSREAVVIFEDVPPEFIWNPVGFVELGKDGNLDQRRKDQHIGGMVWWWVFFGELEGPAFSPETKWVRTETVPALWMLKELPIEHTVQRNDAEIGTLRLVSRFDPGPNFEKRFDIGSWQRQLTLDLGSGRPRSISIHSEGDIKGLSDGATHYAMQIELEEISHRALSKEELASLPKDMKDLKPVVEAFKKSRIRGEGLLSTLLGRKPSSPFPLLEAFEKAHPKSPLLAASKPLRQWIERDMAREKAGKEAEARNEEKATKLLSQPAPDFTLKDLEGKDVSLGDFRGKVVLLVFWHII